MYACIVAYVYVCVRACMRAYMYCMQCMRAHVSYALYALHAMRLIDVMCVDICMHICMYECHVCMQYDVCIVMYVYMDMYACMSCNVMSCHVM